MELPTMNQITLVKVNDLSSVKRKQLLDLWKDYVLNGSHAIVPYQTVAPETINV